MSDDVKAEIFEQLVKEQSPGFFCDNCGHYPIVPMHGHFVCPVCHIITIFCV
jgi:hypothetical protein